jgi:trk system potassium uptake protein TrkA
VRQQIAVIGLGRFGSALALELARAGNDVLGVDADMQVVQRLSSHLGHVVQADVTDESVLESLGVSQFDAAVIGITSHLETSILTTMLLKRMGVPRVVAKAQNELHGEILKRIGADHVVYPERDTGVRLAHAWASTDITDILDVVEGYGVSRILVPPAMVGRTLGETSQERPRSITVFLLARGRKVTVFPTQDERLQEGDVLVLAGEIEDIETFLGRFRKA